MAISLGDPDEDHPAPAHGNRHPGPRRLLEEAAAQGAEPKFVQDFRKLIEDYEREHNTPLADIAAALAVASRDAENFLMEEPAPEPVRERRSRDKDHDRPPRQHDGPQGRHEKSGDLVTYRISVGKRHHVVPGAIVGAIANEGGLRRSDFGHISIRPDFSLVELPEDGLDRLLGKLKDTRVAGKQLKLRRYRED